MLNFKYLKKKIMGEGSGHSLTQLAKRKKKVIGMIAAVSSFAVLMAIGHMARENRKKKPEPKPEPMVVGGIVSSDFTKKNVVSAQEKQQGEIDDIRGNLKKMQKDLEKGFKQHDKAIIKELNAVILKKESRKKRLNSSHALPADRKSMNFAPKPSEIQLSAVSFHYRQPIDQEEIEAAEKKNRLKYVKTPDNYVPATTHVRGVLLEGADANASVNGQSDTVGVLVRLLDNGTLPNGKHSHLKGCNVLARVYGDISSERAEARLNRISCTKPDGTILDKKVQGYLSFAGKEGVKGTPIMRNGKMVFAAGLAGLLSSATSAAQQATQTQSVILPPLKLAT